MNKPKSVKQESCYHFTKDLNPWIQKSKPVETGSKNPF